MVQIKELMFRQYEKSKSLKDYTDEELIYFLSQNEFIDMGRLGVLCSEILRRMNEIKQIFPEKES